MPAISLKFFIVLLSTPIYPSFFIFNPTKVFIIRKYKPASSSFLTLNNLNTTDLQKIPAANIDFIIFQPLDIDEIIIEIEKSIFSPLLVDLTHQTNVDIDSIFAFDSLAGSHYKESIKSLLEELKSSLIKKKQVATTLFDFHKTHLTTLQTKVASSSHTTSVTDNEKKALLSFLILFEKLQSLEHEHREQLNLINNPNKESTYTPYKNEVTKFIANDLSSKFDKANWEPALMTSFFSGTNSPNFSVKNQFVDKDLIKIYATTITLPIHNNEITSIKKETANAQTAVKEAQEKISLHTQKIAAIQKVNISASTKTSIESVTQYETVYKAELSNLKKQSSALNVKKTKAKNALDDAIKNLPKPATNNIIKLLQTKNTLDEFLTHHSQLLQEIKKVDIDIEKFEATHKKLISEKQKINTFMTSINTLLSSHKTTTAIAKEVMENLKTVSDNCEAIENTYFSDQEYTFDLDGTTSLTKQITQDPPNYEKLRKLKQDMQEFLKKLKAFLNITDISSPTNTAPTLPANSKNYEKMKEQYLSKDPDSFLEQNLFLWDSWKLTEKDHDWIVKNCIYQNNKMNFMKLTIQKTRFDSIIKVITDNSKLSQLNTIKNQLKPIITDFNFYWTQVKKDNGKYINVERYKKN